MTERQTGNNLIPSDLERRHSVFEAAVPTSPPALIEFLKLSERQGAYANLSLQTRRILQMRYVEGLNLP